MAFVTSHDRTEPDLGLREKKKRAARMAIIDAALELFAHRGFDNTTIADIAARAEVSPATVARYFDSKESLLFSERDERIPALRHAIVGRPATEAPYRAVARALHEQPWVGNDTEARLLRSRLAIARSPALRGQAAIRLAGWRDGISQALEERKVPAEQARVVGTVAISLLDDAMERWALGGGTSRLFDLIDEAFATLERTWKAGA